MRLRPFSPIFEPKALFIFLRQPTSCQYIMLLKFYKLFFQPNQIGKACLISRVLSNLLNSFFVNITGRILRFISFSIFLLTATVFPDLLFQAAPNL